jgi:hypothetical protein
MRSQLSMAGFDGKLGTRTQTETQESGLRAHLVLADATDMQGRDVKSFSGEISTNVNHFLDDKNSLLAKAKQTLEGPGGIDAALPMYDKAIAETKRIDQKLVKAEIDAVNQALQTETDPAARKILTQEQVDLDLLQRLPAMALANKGLAEKHHRLAQGDIDIAAAQALDPKMATDVRFQNRLRNVELDLAGDGDDHTVARHINLPRNFNTSMSAYEQSKWLLQLPASLSASETREQDQLFIKAIAKADAGPSPMLSNAQNDVARAKQVLKGQGIDTDPENNAPLKNVNTRADALIKTLPADQQDEVALKYSLYTRAVNDTQRTDLRRELTAKGADFGPKMSKILDDFDQVYHLKPNGNAGGNPFFALNLANQKVENEANQTAVTRANYAEVLAQRGDKAGAQKYMKEAIGQNHSKNLAIFLRTLALSPEIGLSAPDVDAIPVTLTTAEYTPPIQETTVVPPRTVVAQVPTTQKVVDSTGTGTKTVPIVVDSTGAGTKTVTKVVTTGGTAEPVEELNP